MGAVAKLLSANDQTLAYDDVGSLVIHSDDYVVLSSDYEKCLAELEDQSTVTRHFVLGNYFSLLNLHEARKHYDLALRATAIYKLPKTSTMRWNSTP